jgi:hypothetical protein
MVRFCMFTLRLREKIRSMGHCAHLLAHKYFAHLRSMSQVSDYLKHAEDARRQAEMASQPEDVAMWLKIADQWMRLAADAKSKGSMW